MLDLTMIVLGTVVGSFGFWLRGSELFHRLVGRGATTARIVCWATPMALLSAVYVSPLIAVCIGISLWIGSIFPWWKSLSLGRNPLDGSWTECAIRHTARGFLWTAFAAAVVWYAGGLWILPTVAGLLVVIPYEIGWRLNLVKPNATEVGELGFGAIVGAALIGSLI